MSTGRAGFHPERLGVQPSSSYSVRAPLRSGWKVEMWGQGTFVCSSQESQGADEGRPSPPPSSWLIPEGGSLPPSLSAEADAADTSGLGLQPGLAFVSAAHLLSPDFASQGPFPLPAYKSLIAAGPSRFWHFLWVRLGKYQPWRRGGQGPN